MSLDAPSEAAVDRHTALASSRWGRWLVVVVVAVVGFWIVAPNMPSGPARSEYESLWRPATNIGLLQDWGVFSPDPRSQSLDVRAVIRYGDGTTATWDVPELDPLVGAYREYRWQKWQERVRLDARQDLWEPTATWIAEQYRRDGELPAEVTLVRRWQDHAQLTADGAVDGEWNEFEFYTWTSAGAMGE